MKKIILLSALFLSAICVLSQNIRWEVTIGVNNRNEGSHHIFEDYDKGYYISGYKFINSYGDGWINKTDVNGNVLYDKILTHAEHKMSVWGAVTDTNGNKYICAPTFDDINWPYVIKLDSCGTLEWCKVLYDDNFEWGGATDILLSNNGEIVVLTKYDSEEEIESIHLVGLDMNGKELWKRPYASRNNYPLIRETSAYDIIKHNNNYYISGLCYYPFLNNPGHFFLRPMFIGIDSLFNEKFVLPFMKRDSVFGKSYSTIAINDTLIMGVGERWLPGINKNSIFMFFTSEGEELGYNQIPNNAIGPDIIANVTRDIERINDSLFMTKSAWGSHPDSGLFGNLVIDTSAMIHNFKGIDYGIVDYEMIKTFDDNYLIAANKYQNNSTWTDIYLYKIDENLESVPFDTVPHTYDSLCPHAIQSEVIDLTDCLVITNIGELPGPAQYYESLRWIPIKAYPNPVREGKVTLEFENTEHHQNMELRCYNNFGREIHRQKIYKGQQDTDVNVSAWGKGVYIAVIYSNGGAVGKVKFVVEGGRW